MANPWNLPPREYDILEVMAVTGRCSNKEAARELKLSPATVKLHLYRAMKRMGVHTRSEAVLTWDRHNRTCPDCFAARLKRTGETT